MSYNSASYYLNSNNMVSSNKKPQYSANKQQSVFNGFVFKKKNEKIDWRRIASLDIDRVAKELDFTALQENIDHITFCNIEAEIDTRLMDPNFVKLFKLSQLTIEYLLQTQEYLTSLITDSEMNFDGYRTEAEELKKSNEKLQKELQDLKKENKKRKKLIEAQQNMINVNQTNYHRCVYCSKVFLNVNYLQAHINRRHNQMPFAYSQPSAQPTQPVQQPLQTVQNSEIEKELNKIKEKLQQTEIELQQERNARINNAKEDVLLRKMEEWKNEQMRKHTEDMNTIKEKFLREIEDLNVKNANLEKSQFEMQNRIGKQSNVGWMRDEMDVDKEYLMKQQNELEMLRAKDQSLSKHIEELNEKWQYKDHKLREKYKLQLEEKNAIIEDLNNKITKRSKEFENEMQKRSLQEQRKRQKVEANLNIAKRQQEVLQERNQPPPITPRHGVRSPSPPKSAISDVPQYRQRTPSRQSMTVDLLLPDYCPKLKEALKYDENILNSFRNKVKTLLTSELDDIGIYPEDTGLSTNDFKMKMNDLQRYRDAISRELPHFNQMRKIFVDICDEHCKQKLQSSLRSSNGGGNRVTFHKNVVTTKGHDQIQQQQKNNFLNGSSGSLNMNSSSNKKPQQNKIQEKFNQRNPTRSESEETNDEISISNAIESNDDDTEPTKQNFNRNYNNNLLNPQKMQLQQPKRQIIPPPQQQRQQQQQQQQQQLRSQSRSPYQYSEDDLESVTQIQDMNENKQINNKSSNGYVARTTKSIDKELGKIMNRGQKPAANAVPMGFRNAAPLMKQDPDYGDDSVSSIEMTENSKNHKNPKFQQESMDTSQNTSIWASVSHGINNYNNNNHEKSYNNMNGGGSRNDFERPDTANSIVTTDFDDYDRL